MKPLRQDHQSGKKSCTGPKSRFSPNHGDSTTETGATVRVHRRESNEMEKRKKARVVQLDRIWQEEKARARMERWCPVTLGGAI